MELGKEVWGCRGVMLLGRKIVEAAALFSLLKRWWAVLSEGGTYSLVWCYLHPVPLHQ